MWQAGPSWSTLTSRVSPSQSSRTSLTHWRWPEVSPLTQYSWRRAAPVRRPAGRQRAGQRLVVHPAEHQHLAGVVLLHDRGHEPVGERLRRSAMAGSRAVTRRPVSCSARSRALLGDPGGVQAGVDAVLLATSSACGPRWTIAAAVDDDDLVGVLGGGEPVGDRDRGAAATSAARAPGRSASRGPGRRRWWPRRARAGRGRRAGRAAARPAAAPPPTATRRAGRPGCRGRAAGRPASRRGRARRRRRGCSASVASSRP